MTINTPNNIVKDYARDNLFDPLGLARLRESYMREDEQSPQDRLAYVSNIFSSNPDLYFLTDDPEMDYPYLVF